MSLIAAWVGPQKSKCNPTGSFLSLANESGAPILVSKLVKDLGVQAAHVFCPSAQCTQSVYQTITICTQSVCKTIGSSSKNSFHPSYGASPWLWYASLFPKPHYRFTFVTSSTTGAFIPRGDDDFRIFGHKSKFVFYPSYSTATRNSKVRATAEGWNSGKTENYDQQNGPDEPPTPLLVHEYACRVVRTTTTTRNDIFLIQSVRPHKSIAELL